MSDAIRKPCPHCGGTGEVWYDERAGALLRGMRERTGLTAKDVAARLGISPQYLSDLERGRRRWTPALVGAFQDTLAEAGLRLVSRSC